MEAEPAIVFLWVGLGIAAFFAGVVDAVIGGGGMVQLPALFAFMPGVPPAPLHAPRHSPRKAAVIAASGNSAIGFYDGFLGAGTGAFYKMLFVRGLGFSFLNAAAPAKFTNVASNLGAVVMFALTGYLYWMLGLWMAAANFAGGQLGARIALRYGNEFIRYAFYVVVSALIAKTFVDAYL